MKKAMVLVVMTLMTISVLAFKTSKNRIPNLIPPIVSEPTLETSIGSITESSCRAELEYLASDGLEGRMSGKKGNVLAAEFIKRKLYEAGLKPVVQRFGIKRANPGPNNEAGDDFTENVYAIIKGSEAPGEIVVMGAHFDHIGYGPAYSRSRRMQVHNGADDNASGTVAVLEAAKALSKLKPKRTILVQFYSAEEMGLLGSRYYCENPMFPEGSPDISKHVAMVNLDMIGHLNSSGHKVSIPDSSLDIGKHVDKLSEKYGFSKGITGNGTGRGSGGSDHAPFHNKKIPVAFIHTGLHEHYHTPSDDVETLNMAGIVEVAKYAAELVWNLANDVSLPEFDESKFEEMPYTNDHGAGRF